MKNQEVKKLKKEKQTKEAKDVATKDEVTMDVKEETKDKKEKDGAGKPSPDEIRKQAKFLEAIDRKIRANMGVESM